MDFTLTQANYTLYSLTELREALEHIDHEKYPERIQTIIKEIESRQEASDAMEAECKQASHEQFNEDLHPNWFIRYWKGQVSLPISYWVVGIGVNAFIFASAELLAVAMTSSSRSWHLGAYILGLYSLTFVLVTWKSVGLYRTARKHPLRTGDTGWATIALIMLFIGLINFSFQIYRTGIPIIKSGVEIILGQTNLEKTEFRIMNDGKDLELMGNIDIGSNKMLIEQLHLHPNVTRIHLHSSGGRILAASRMMKTIKQYKLDTYVKTECASACTLLFIAGQNKLLASDAKLKFHAPGIGGTSTHDIEELGQFTQQAYEQEDLPAWFVMRVMETPHDTFWVPSESELFKAKIIDQIVDAKLLPTSGLGPVSSITTEQLEIGLQTVDYMYAMKQYDPNTYQQIIDINLKGMIAGIPLNSISAQVRDVVYEERLPIYLSSASNEALVVYWQAQIYHMKELKEQYPLACASLSFPEQVPVQNRYGNEGGMSEMARSKEMESLTLLIQTYSEQHAKFDDATKDALVQELLAKLGERDEKYLEVISSAKSYINQPTLLCEASIALNEAFVSFDKDTSGQLLRSLQ